MNTLSNEKTKDIMLKLYPTQSSPQESKPQLPAPKEEKTQAIFRPKHSAHPFITNQIKKTSSESKKWYISIILACLSTFLFSFPSLNFLDDICARKNIEAFDKKGDPKLLLLLVLFILLVFVSRTLLMFL
jgi:hypothetical protein